MPAGIKALWLKALRGKSKLGEYSQCRGSLSKTEYVEGVVLGTSGAEKHTFCCLGVLQNELNGFCDFDHDNSEVIGLKAYPASSYPPDDVCKRANLNRDTKRILSKMNDNQNKSFEQIADWIEENL